MKPFHYNGSTACVGLSARGGLWLQLFIVRDIDARPAEAGYSLHVVIVIGKSMMPKNPSNHVGCRYATDFGLTVKLFADHVKIYAIINDVNDCSFARRT